MKKPCMNKGSTLKRPAAASPEASDDEEGEEEEEEVSFIGHEKSLGGILMGGSAHSSRRHLGRDADTEHHTTVVYNFDVRILCFPFMAVQNYW